MALSCAFLDAVNAGYHAEAVPCATRVANNNFWNNFYENIFWRVQGMSQILATRFLDK